MSDRFYRAFEDKHRGSRDLIKTRLRVYLPFIEPLARIYAGAGVIDLGCGRGEWLELLNGAGVPAYGVDLDDEMLADCRVLGLMVKTEDALAALRGLPDASQIAVTGFHLAEHIPFGDLKVLVQEALRVLKPAGLLILETPNPENIVVGTTNFYLDPTHRRPIPPQLLSFLPEHYGFGVVKLLRLQEHELLRCDSPVSLIDVLSGVSPDYAVVAQKAAEEWLLAETSQAFSRDYGLTMNELAARYDQGVSASVAQAESHARDAVLKAEQVEAKAREFELGILTAGARVQDAELKAQEAAVTAREAEAKAHEAEVMAREAETKARNAEAKAHEAEAIVREAEAKVSLAETAATDARSAAQTAEAQAQAARGRAEQVEAVLVAVLQSRSWRLTSPLRWLAQQISALRDQGLTARARAAVKKLSWSTRREPAVAWQEQPEERDERSKPRRPRLALDMYVLGQGIKTGVYRVCDELFQRLAQSARFDVRYVLRDGFEPAVTDYIHDHRMRGRTVAAAAPNPSRDADILLSPFGVAPREWLDDPKVVQAHIIYDLIAIRRPEFFSFEAVAEVNAIVASLNEKSIIFAISEFTKRDLLAYRSDLRPDQVTVIPLAAGENFKPCADKASIESVRRRYGIPSEVPYVLSLATLEIRKNLDKVVESFLLYLDQYPASEIHLVLAGMSGWKLEKLNDALAAAGSRRNRIILTGFVEDEDLSALYSDAKCFVYLSQYEGFGLPPLEAMACGTPVIAADNSSLPEVVGDAGLLVDANDVCGVADALHRIVSSDALRSELSAQGIARAREFDWDRCANIVSDTLCRKLELERPDVFQFVPNSVAATTAHA